MKFETEGGKNGYSFPRLKLGLWIHIKIYADFVSDRSHAGNVRDSLSFICFDGLDISPGIVGPARKPFI